MRTLEEEIKTSTFTSSKLRAGLNLLFTSYWLNEQWSSLFKSFDLSQPQYNVLRILRGQKGNPINLCDIQSRMIERNSNATRIVEKLRQKGLVTRSICAVNRRKVEIIITKKGMNLLAKMDPFIEEKEKNIFGSITKQDAETLNQLLNKLRKP